MVGVPAGAADGAARSPFCDIWYTKASTTDTIRSIPNDLPTLEVIRRFSASAEDFQDVDCPARFSDEF